MVHLNASQLSLYGMALAVVPERDNPSRLKIICSPISVENQSRNEVNVLEDLAFKISVDQNNIPEVMQAFVRISNTLEILVRRQHESLEAHGLSYRPVALEWGQDSRSPVDLDVQKLACVLFGRPVRDVSTPDQINASIAKAMAKERGKISPRAGYWKARLALENYNKALGSVIETGKAKRQHYFTQNPSLPPDFSDACEKLPKLLDQCTLKWGNFNPGVFPTNEEPTDFDHKISYLMDEWRNGNVDAFQKLQEEAFQLGLREGEAMSAQPNAFGNHGGPNKHDPEFIRKHAGYYFYQLDEAFEAKFRAGFDETFTSNYTRRIKFPLDVDRPPFVDPCAAMLVDQFQIIDGTRDAENIRDSSDWRERIASAASHALKDRANPTSVGSAKPSSSPLRV